jgi:hypothetical protein
MPRKTKATKAAAVPADTSEETLSDALGANIFASVHASLQALAAVSASPHAQIKALAAEHSRPYRPPEFRRPLSLEKAALPADRAPTDQELYRLLVSLFFWLQTEHPDAAFDAEAILFDRPDQRYQWGLLTTFLLSKVCPTLFPDRLLSLGGRPKTELTPQEMSWLLDGIEALRATWPNRQRFNLVKACQDLKDGKWQPCPTNYAKYKNAPTLALHYGAIIQGRPVHRSKSRK